MKRILFSRNRGITSVLAMLYMTLFSVLAVGFYAIVSTSMHVADNDGEIANAYADAESGLGWFRYQLGQVDIPGNTQASGVIDALYTDLQTQLNGTTNLSGGSIGRSGSTVFIPASTSTFIPLDSTGENAFNATITDWAGEIVVKVTGRHATARQLAAGNATLRTVTMEFTRQTMPSPIFAFSVASKGKVSITKGAITTVDPTKSNLASMMSSSVSAGAVSISGGSIGGTLNILQGATASVTGGTVSGSSNISYINSHYVNTVGDPDYLSHVVPPCARILPRRPDMESQM